MVGRNQRKLQVLQVLSRFKACYASEIAYCLGIGLNHARVLLRHYHKQGLVRREVTNEGHYIYWLSRKGEERLRWLEAQQVLPARLLE